MREKPSSTIDEAHVALAVGAPPEELNSAALSRLSIGTLKALFHLYFVVNAFNFLGVILISLSKFNKQSLIAN